MRTDPIEGNHAFLGQQNVKENKRVYVTHQINLLCKILRST
jgi:hypothetical protein